MNRTVTIAPVRKTITVKASQEVAFETFTAGIGAWWPKDHGIGKSKLMDVRLEPRRGGRAFEIDEDGAEVKWGTVLVWEPYSRLVFTWQITADWQPSPNDDASVHSEVEVRFVPEGATATRVELEHRNFERMGDGPGNQMRGAVDRGWPGLLQLYGRAAGGVEDQYGAATKESQDYQSSISVNIPAGTAFQKIGRVSEWWTRKGFTGESQKLGDRFSVRFGETFVNFEIVDVVPDRKIVWRVDDSSLHWLKDKKEWNGTTIIWDLSSEQEGTRVRMTHRGLTAELECFEQIRERWNFYVGQSLLKLLTENRGLPDRERG